MNKQFFGVLLMLLCTSASAQVHKEFSDTLRAQLMISDTTIYKGLESCVLRTMDERDICVAERIPYFFWLFGYVVHHSNKVETYLDDKKKPLHKTLIVWQWLKRY